MARKEHIKRVFGRDRDGNEVKDVHADLRRTEEMEIVDLGTGQETVVIPDWGDDEAEPDLERVTIVKLTDPENPPADPEDPDLFIPIPVVKKATVDGVLQGPLYSLALDRPQVSQESDLTFSTDQEASADDLGRVVRTLRVPFAETDVDEALDAGQRVAIDDYHRDEDTKDDAQYVDWELIDSYQIIDADQEAEVDLDHEDDPILAAFEPTPEDRPQRPLRLDPWQHLVNVQWAGNPEFFWSEIDGLPSDAPGGLEGDGYVYQNSCPAADSYSFSMSAVVRVKFPAVSAGDDGLDYYHIFLMIPDVEGFFDQDHEPPEHDFYAKWEVGINIWLEDDRTSDFCILRLWWGSRPIDLNDSAINVPSPDIGEPERVGLQFPPFVHSATVHYQENSFIEKEKVKDGFHLFLTIDNSPAASYAALGDPADAPATQLSGPKFEIWVDGEDYGSLAGPFPGNKAGQAIPLLGWTRATVAEPVYEGAEPPFMSDSFEQVTDLGIIHTEDDTIATTTVEFGQVADVGANKFAYSGLKVGFPIISNPTQGYSAETDPFEASIQLAKVQVWTNQIISPSNIVPYFLTEEGKKPVSVSAAQEKFGKAAYVLDGPPKSFAANKRGSAGEMTLAGRIRTGNIRRSGS